MSQGLLRAFRAPYPFSSLRYRTAAHPRLVAPRLTSRLWLGLRLVQEVEVGREGFEEAGLSGFTPSSAERASKSRHAA